MATKSLTRSRAGIGRLLLFTALALGLLLVGGIGSRPAQAAPIDPGFNPAPGNLVYDILLLPDGKILVGGAFSTIGGASQRSIGRLNPDGSADTGFAPAAVGAVRAIARQPDGRIVVGGESRFLPGGQIRHGLNRLNGDGSLDAGFTPPTIQFNATSGRVEAVALQADGKILIGGNFTTVAGQPRQNIARLNPNGSLDAGFNPGANDRVRALKVLANGQILVGGDMTTLAGQPRSYLGRLNGDGSLDAGFPATAGIINDRVHVITVQADGKVVVGGRFGGSLRRFNLDGSTDLTFLPTTNGSVYDLAIQADGRIVVGGEFSRINNRLRRQLGRINGDGSLDASFNPGTDRFVRAVAAQPDGRVLVGGFFTQLGGVTRRNLGRTNPTAPTPLPDPAFDPAVDNVVSGLALQPDGKIIVGGSFTQIDGQPRSRVARLNGDGSLDPGFVPGEVNFTVSVVAVQGDGKILVGGSFTQLGGEARASIGRLNPDGTLDAAFNPGVLNGTAPGQVNALVLQPDGKILVGGLFSSLGGQPRQNIGRLNPDGTVDPAFNPGADSLVRALALQPDGKILVGGAFVSLAGEVRPYFGRLNADGALDVSVTPALNNWVQAIALQPDGKIIVGGRFGCPGYSSNVVLRLEAGGGLDSSFMDCAGSWSHWFDGEITALALQPDGKILVGGWFTLLSGKPTETLGRLTGSGAPDASFNPTSNGLVNRLLLLPDDTVLVSGSFGDIGGRRQPFVARLIDPLASLTFKGYYPLVIR